MQVGKPFYLVAGSKRGIVLHQGLLNSTRSKANKVQAGHTNNASPSVECTGNPAERWCELHPIWCKDWSQGHVTSNGNSATGNWKTSFWENQPHWFFVCLQEMKLWWLVYFFETFKLPENTSKKKAQDSTANNIPASCWAKCSMTSGCPQSAPAISPPDRFGSRKKWDNSRFVSWSSSTLQFRFTTLKKNCY